MAIIGWSTIFCISKEMVGLIPLSLSFSAGVIIYLSFMNLIPEAVELLFHATGEEDEALVRFYVLLCVIGGLAITVAMEMLFKKLGVHSHGMPNDMGSGSGSDTSSSVAMTKANTTSPAVTSAENEEENASEQGQDIEVQMKEQQEEDDVAGQTDLSWISYTVAFALILHHFPEGIATFISFYYDFEFGVLVAFALAVHDIPSGICIAVTTFCATGSKLKPFIMCLIAALVYPFGALIGWAVVETTSDEFSDIFIGVLFGITGGIMLYVAFVELLPTAILAAQQHAKTNKNVYTISLCLLFAGFLVMDISSILLAESGGHSH